MDNKNDSALKAPRMCEVLDVRADEQWRVKEDAAIYRVNAGGLVEYRTPGDGEWKLSDVLHLSVLINQPELIIRGPIWTDEELFLLRMCRRSGVNWLSRDSDSGVVDMWSEKPELSGGGYKGTMVGSVPVGMFPSMFYGQVVRIEADAPEEG